MLKADHGLAHGAVHRVSHLHGNATRWAQPRRRTRPTLYILARKPYSGRCTTTPPTGWLEPAAEFNPLFTHRVRITAATDLDDELRSWSPPRTRSPVVKRWNVQCRRERRSEIPEFILHDRTYSRSAPAVRPVMKYRCPKM
jgi:hypothetical protein